MSFIINPQITRSGVLERLFIELGLSDADSVACGELLKADPTSNMKFGFYLLRLYALADKKKRDQLVDEDFDKLKTYLWCVRELESHQISIKVHRKVGGNRVPLDLPELYSALEPHFSLIGDMDLPDYAEGVLGGSLVKFRPAPAIDPKTQTEEQIRSAGAAAVLFEEGPIKLVQINTLEGARWYGQNTVWCTAYLHTAKHFERYNKDGGLYVLILNGTDKYQFHFQQGALNDSKDKAIEFADICSQHAFLNEDASPLKSQLVHALAGAALNDGRKNNYYPHQYLWGSYLPEDLQASSVQLALDLLGQKEWRYIEFSFLPEIGKLAPIFQTKAMEVMQIYANHEDSLIRSFPLEYLPRQFDQLTSESREMAYAIFEKLAQDTDDDIQRYIRDGIIPKRPTQQTFANVTIAELPVI